MGSEDVRSAYRLHERDWESYDELRSAFEWQIPERFNIARAICDPWGETDHPAIFEVSVDGRRDEYTFAELDRISDRFARALTDVGIEPGDRVGVNTPQRPETVFAHLGAWKAGACTVPLSPLFGPDALQYRLSDTDAKLCIADESTISTLRSVRPKLDALETTIVTADAERGGDEPGIADVELGDEPADDVEGDERGFWAAIDDVDAGFDPVDTAAEDDAVIIFTSGTTGDPKGVRHAHRVLLGHLPPFLTMVCNLQVDDESVFWKPADWAWTTIFDGLMPPLYYGRPILAHNRTGFDPERAFELLDEFGVTNFSVPPTALRTMTQVEDAGKRYDLSSVRVVQSGGESLDEGLVDWVERTFGTDAVHEAYGQTEANVIAGDCTALADARPGTIGRPAPGFDVRIVDPETGDPTVEQGAIGEIALRYDGNPICFREYWNAPEQTAEKVVDGWLLTEDLGSIDADGYLRFKSRSDDVIISAGYRIGPEEVEGCLTDHDAVADAGVIGVPDERRGQVPKAFVVPAAEVDHEEFENELKRHVRDRLAKYEYPRTIEFVDDLPTTTSGKVNRNALKEREGLTA